jgi:hypothetical protein
MIRGRTLAEMRGHKQLDHIRFFRFAILPTKPGEKTRFTLFASVLPPVPPFRIVAERSRA